MTTSLVCLLLGTPLLICVVMFVFGRHLPKQLQVLITLGTAGLVLVCLLISFTVADTKFNIAPQWWPGSGELYLKFDTVGLAAAVWTTASGLTFYVLALRDPSPRPGLQGGFLLIVITMANLAFLAGNFLFRYAALEITALAITAVVLLETGSRNSKYLYLGLRLGDAGLLAAILLLNASGTSFDISKSLELALHLSPTNLSWISAGFTLAAWVKMGIWPLLFWQEAAANSISIKTKAWFLSTVMPNLGVYLLYKTMPLITQITSLQSAISLAAAASGIIALLYAWRKKDLHDNILWLLAFQGSIVVFAAAHRLDNLVWISILSASLIRIIAFGWHYLLPQKKRRIELVWGAILSAYSFIVIWAVQHQGEDKIDFWLAEASLAMLMIWCFKNREESAGQTPQKHSHQRKWQHWGFLVFPLLLFVILPLLIPFFKANGEIDRLFPFTRHSLRSLPIISPAFWGLLIGVWVVNKSHWLEITNKHTTMTWPLWLKRLQHIPESIYKFTEIVLFQKGVQQAAYLTPQIAKRLYEITEIALFQKGMQQAAHLAPQLAKRLYEIFEKSTFDAGLNFLVNKSFAFSTLLRRMHTGRLRINLLWVAATMLTVLVFI